MFDATNLPFLLRGMEVRGLEIANPTAAGQDARRALTQFTFRIIRQRWNMNTVRLPVSVPLWKRDGQAYLDQITAAIAAANQESLVVVLAAEEDARSGANPDTGLPSADTPAFWRACAQALRNSPGVIFSLFHEPSVRNVPGSGASARRTADWQVWRNGGALNSGQSATGMQSLVDAIRASGASQVIAASAFHDPLGFQGFSPAFYLNDPQIVYEIHPFFDQGLTDEAREANFGFLAGVFPIYAGAWGMPLGQSNGACTAVPRDLSRVSDLLFQTFFYFDRRGMSWTVADFEPGSLIQNYTDYSPTLLNNLWSCDASSDPKVGMGQFVLLTMTGDPNGFGSLDPNLIAGAAGGFGGAPLAPGEIVSIYGQLVGPDTPAAAPLDSAGRLPTVLAGLQVFFDGIPAPIFYASYFQVNLQVPYELAGRKTTRIQLVYRTIPSNLLEMAVADSAPGIFTILGTSEAAALNEDGSVNGFSHPAPRGTVVSLFATGDGLTSPASVTGRAAGLPLAYTVLPVTLTMGSRMVEVLYAGAAPGFVGAMQVNARIPTDFPGDPPPQRASLVLSVGPNSSRLGVTLWVK